jgi:hypothetical protein
VITDVYKTGEPIRRTETRSEALVRTVPVSSTALFNLTVDTYDEHDLQAMAFRATVEKYVKDDSAWNRHSNLMRKWSGGAFPTAEVVSAIPVVGGVLAPIAKQAPSLAFAMTLVAVVALIIRTLAGAYEALLVKGVERRLALLKLQLDVANVLATLDPRGAEGQRGSIAELRSKSHELTRSLRRRSARAERLIGSRAFWRWPAARRVAIGQRFQKFLERAPGSRSQGMERILKALGISLLLLGGCDLLGAYLALALIPLVLLDNSPGTEKALPLGVFAIVSLCAALMGYSFIRWGQSVMWGVRKWRRKHSPRTAGLLTSPPTN